MCAFAQLLSGLYRFNFQEVQRDSWLSVQMLKPKHLPLPALPLTCCEILNKWHARVFQFLFHFPLCLYFCYSTCIIHKKEKKNQNKHNVHFLQLSDWGGNILYFFVAFLKISSSLVTITIITLPFLYFYALHSRRFPAWSLAKTSISARLLFSQLFILQLLAPPVTWLNNWNGSLYPTCLGNQTFSSLPLQYFCYKFFHNPLRVHPTV